MDVLVEGSFVAHPQGNGQVEAVNKILKASIKKIFEAAKESWPVELSNVLSGYRATTRASTGHTPFALTYGCEAMLPVEMKVPSSRKQTASS